MRATNLLAYLLLLACMGGTVFAQENPFLGKWNITGTGQFSNYIFWLEVKNEDGKLVGYFLNRSGSVLKLPEISIEEGVLRFTPAPRSDGTKSSHTAKVDEGRLLGMAEYGETEIAWIGVRPPQWGNQNANGRHRMGAPVVLFDGKTMTSIDNWELQHKDKPSGWTVVDQAMTNEAKANNLISRHRFENFKILCEYKLEEKSNSGIFLRGRYELQVVDDAGKDPDIHGNMALYSRVKPLVNASLPAGQWNVMEATIVGNRLTVFLNNKKVQDNILIEGITGGALDCNESDPGPLMIQGDHGKVWYRRIVVTPILKR